MARADWGLFLAGATLGVALIAARPWADRSTRMRNQLRLMYADSRRTRPIFYRCAGPLGFLWGTGWILVSAIALVPTVWAAGLLMLPGLVMMQVAFGLSYRLPPALLPRWLRKEIQLGTIQAARPTTLDWVILAMVLPILVIADVGIPYLIVQSANP
jgi:hypothetical protein